MKIRIRKEEGALEILAKVENKTSFLERCHTETEAPPKIHWDINTHAPNSDLTY